MVRAQRTRASFRLFFLLLVFVVDHNSLDFHCGPWPRMVSDALSKGYMLTGNDSAVDANKHGGDDDSVICVKKFLVVVLVLLVFL